VALHDKYSKVLDSHIDELEGLVLRQCEPLSMRAA
jgi:hypothetical protein